MSGISWAEFTASDMALAEAGARLLLGDDGNAIGYLATTSATGRPHLAPVCPVFSRGCLYLIGAAGTPKVTDLRAGGEFVLHAFLGAEDEEFQITGIAAELADADARDKVQQDIPFPSWSPDDPIFELRVRRSQHVVWRNFGQPDMTRLINRWPA